MAIQTTTTSKQFTISGSDIWKGLIMAVIMPVLVIIQNSISAGSLEFNWKAIGLAAVGGLIAYLIKNFFTPSQVVIKNPELAKEIKDGDKELQAVPK